MNTTMNTTMNAQPNSDYDLAIVGSGSAAFAAAIHAVSLGARVVLVERGALGGTCVNVGCVPSKALLAASNARAMALHQPFPGISTSASSVDMGALISGKAALVDELRREKYEELAERFGFVVLHGTARFEPGERLMVDVSGEEADDREVIADYYLLATGASPATAPIAGLTDVDYLTSTTAMELRELPRRLLVIGGNSVGLEQAQLFADLGSAVTIIEARDRIAPFAEPEISAVLTDVFKNRGVEILTSTSIERVWSNDGQIAVRVSISGESESREAEALLVATGRAPNTAGLGLEHVGVELGNRGEIIVDNQLRTTNTKIFAAGDVTGAPQFVYVAGAHGTLVAENALRNAGRTIDYRTLPRVTFITPQIASVGLTDEEAVAEGYACSCRVVELKSLTRARVNRDVRGLVKIVADASSGRVLGIHLLADGASEAILAGVYALEANFTVDQLASIWAPYLTVAEAIRLGAQAFTRDVKLLSCCAS